MRSGAAHTGHPLAGGRPGGSFSRGAKCRAPQGKHSAWPHGAIWGATGSSSRHTGQAAAGGGGGAAAAARGGGTGEAATTSPQATGASGLACAPKHGSRAAASSNNSKRKRAATKEASCPPGGGLRRSGGARRRSGRWCEGEAEPSPGKRGAAGACAGRKFSRWLADDAWRRPAALPSDGDESGGELEAKEGGDAASAAAVTAAAAGSDGASAGRGAAPAPRLCRGRGSARERGGGIAPRWRGTATAANDCGAAGGGVNVAAHGLSDVDAGGRSHSSAIKAAAYRQLITTQLQHLPPARAPTRRRAVTSGARCRRFSINVDTKTHHYTDGSRGAST